MPRWMAVVAASLVFPSCLGDFVAKPEFAAVVVDCGNSNLKVPMKKGQITVIVAGKDSKNGN